MKKGWIIFTILVVTIIIAFAIYKVSTTKNTVVVTGGGSETKSNNGIGNLIPSFLAFL